MTSVLFDCEQAIHWQQAVLLSEVKRDSHLLSVGGMSGGRKDTVVVDGSRHRIWSLYKYIQDQAVGSLVNCPYENGGKANAKFTFLPVPPDQIYRFNYTDAPEMQYVCVVEATKPIAAGAQILIDYGPTYTRKHFLGSSD